MPFLEESDHASDSVFTDTEASLEPHSSSPGQHIIESPIPTVLSSGPPESPTPRRSTRSTRGAPLV